MGCAGEDGGVCVLVSVAEEATLLTRCSPPRARAPNCHRFAPRCNARRRVARALRPRRGHRTVGAIDGLRRPELACAGLHRPQHL